MMTKILCVEDNFQNMRLLEKILETAGYDIVEATDGASGVAMAEQEMPDLILMDVNLPDIDGLEATRRIKATPQLAGIPVIALTANVMHGDRNMVLAAGCDGYLAKPILRSEVLQAITLMLRRFSSRNNGNNPA